MSRTLHALIVGISHYQYRNIAPLSQSVPLAKKMASWLSGKFPTSSRDTLNLTQLHDRQATRSNILGQLQILAGSVRPGDTCLFHFIGHGSQELAPLELCSLEDDDLFETIVCYDSRADTRNYDIADKELAYLINEKINPRNDVHFTAIMDCCHSGDSNREGKVNPKISGIDALENTMRAPNKYVGHHTFKSASTPKSIALAACQPNEKAENGIFTESLLRVLMGSSQAVDASYTHLMNSVKGEMRRERQTPAIFPRNSHLKNTPFLNGILK